MTTTEGDGETRGALAAWLARAPGTSLDASQASVVVSQERIDGFGKATGDEQWIHKANAPNGAIAHGFLTLSLLTALTEDATRAPWARRHINYGLNRVRFIHPVRANDVLRVKELKLTAVRALANGQGAQTEYAVALHVDGVDAAPSRVVLVASWITRQYLH